MTVQNVQSSNLAAQLKRGYQALEDEEWEAAECKKIVDEMDKAAEKIRLKSEMLKEEERQMMEEGKAGIFCFLHI